MLQIKFVEHPLVKKSIVVAVFSTLHEAASLALWNGCDTRKKTVTRYLTINMDGGLPDFNPNFTLTPTSYSQSVGWIGGGDDTLALA